GATYSYTRSSEKKKQGTYLNFNLDTSGNLLGLLTGSYTGRDRDNSQLFGQPYAQYVKGSIDLRKQWQVGPRKGIFSKVVLGVGIPYGNSEQLPYTKQFFAGGANSIRAFPARGIGPGTYVSDNEGNLLFIDQSGDIKFESSLEYRTHIYGVIKGALFVDAGNIWLLNEDEQRPGGQFRADDFLSQIAIGSGAGIRLDFGYFVVRFDLAFPIRRVAGEKAGWVLNEVNPLSKDWRRDNMILNIAIGYPF
ncbi:MAG: BamA/TamA family outer membrane protein, partial [Bacteroidota bacterium]